jgi:hypothetical protein
VLVLSCLPSSHLSILPLFHSNSLHLLVLYLRAVLEINHQSHKLKTQKQWIISTRRFTSAQKGVHVHSEQLSSLPWFLSLRRKEIPLVPDCSG